jgi:hypothetical protein
MNETLHDALATARWVYPDQRVGQILVNAVLATRPDLTNEDLHHMLFYMSNDDLAKAVAAYVAQPSLQVGPFPVRLDPTMPRDGFRLEAPRKEP